MQTCFRDTDDDLLPGKCESAAVYFFAFVCVSAWSTEKIRSLQILFQIITFFGRLLPRIISRWVSEGRNSLGWARVRGRRGWARVRGSFPGRARRPSCLGSVSAGKKERVVGRELVWSCCFSFPVYRCHPDFSFRLHFGVLFPSWLLTSSPNQVCITFTDNSNVNVLASSKPRLVSQ
jgi:hypothetical protein